MDNWRKTLQLERRHCNDKDYASNLAKILFIDPFNLTTKMGLGIQRRPYANEIETALQMACDESDNARFYWQKRLIQLDKAKRSHTPIQKLIADLSENHWFERFVARHVLVNQGGEAVDDLLTLAEVGSNRLHVIALWILQSIGKETVERLGETTEPLKCMDCFVASRPEKIEFVGVPDITYYACPICQQSRNFRSWPDGIVAILDGTFVLKHKRRPKIVIKEQVRINWHLHPHLFDFDWVEIINATDEDVERFVVQIGNDADYEQKRRVKNMMCHISPNCTLSENTLRILERTFAQVQIR
ncbi:MAG: hypothetical protein AAF629_04750 [Chloroflexota bacterium]